MCIRDRVDPVRVTIQVKYRPNHPLSTRWNVQDLLPPQITDKQIKRIWNEAHSNLRASLEKSRRYHEKGNHSNSIRYQVGDLVMYQTHPISSAIDKTTSKLSFRWCGPYQIQKYLTPVTVAPVSYTHLPPPDTDRNSPIVSQVQANPEPNTDTHVNPPSPDHFQFRPGNNELSTTPNAVSYTHLDVYKRQI